MDESAFFRLPTELRLHIYGYALYDTAAITIGSAKLVGSPPDVVHQLYADGRAPTPGLPCQHIPLIQPDYQESLLSLTNPAVFPAASLDSGATSTLPYCTKASLHLICRQTHHDLLTHFNAPHHRQTRLFLSYPDGLHLLRTLPRASTLLSQTRSIHIAGSYTSHSFSAPRAANLGSNAHPPFVDQHFNGGFSPNSAGQLSTLLASLFGPKPAHAGLTKLELRVYYPGSDSYSVVWGDDNSPIVIALRNVFDGQVAVEVWRGQRGTGVYLCATRTVEKGEKPKRVVSTVWRRLEEGRRGEPQCGSWVVDEKWPECGDEPAKTPTSEGVVVTEG